MILVSFTAYLLVHFPLNTIETDIFMFNCRQSVQQAVAVRAGARQASGGAGQGCFLRKYQRGLHFRMPQ